ncbi:hypothetical protein KIN20_032646 [Parelaphostrongylus tenuis]|uniref:Uncharacterized protein n=1 Tax=Parelaphostrongylus tenuis TaxID=148309 RepID=A0AAD5R7H9_PARTN|nr:hypothetical protein KIN20_032646 [Parelaphostrongylus tenuis]
MNLIGDELRQWENALHLAAKPGIFTIARRIIVHPKFTKSYAYNTFVTLNSFGVEMKIFDGPAEMVQWIQKNLKLDTVQHCPFEMWRGGETHLKKEEEQMTDGRKEQWIGLQECKRALGQPFRRWVELVCGQR